MTSVILYCINFRHVISIDENSLTKFNLNIQADWIQNQVRQNPRELGMLNDLDKSTTLSNRTKAKESN